MRVQLQNDCRKNYSNQKVSGKNPHHEINAKGSKSEYYRGRGAESWVIKLNVQANIKQRFFFTLLFVLTS